jgi:hypothetical protein
MVGYRAQTRKALPARQGKGKQGIQKEKRQKGKEAHLKNDSHPALYWKNHFKLGGLWMSYHICIE